MSDTTTVTAVTVATDLAELAAAINAEHAACGRALTTGLEHAIRAGELLIQARHAIPHGGWLPWLGAHFDGSARTAQAYMRVARRRAEFGLPDAQRVAHLSFREALATLAAPALSPETIGAEGLIGAGAVDIEAHFAGIKARLGELRIRLDGLPRDAASLPEIVAIAREADGWEQHATVVRLLAERRCGGLLKMIAAMQVDADDRPAL
jgi:hypothetical protein